MGQLNVVSSETVSVLVDLLADVFADLDLAVVAGWAGWYPTMYDKRSSKGRHAHSPVVHM